MVCRLNIHIKAKAFCNYGMFLITKERQLESWLQEGGSEKLLAYQTILARNVREDHPESHFQARERQGDDWEQQHDLLRANDT